MHEVLVKHLEGLSLSRKSVIRLTDRPDMTLDVYPGRKTTIQQQQITCLSLLCFITSFQLVCVFMKVCCTPTEAGSVDHKISQCFRDG